MLQARAWPGFQAPTATASTRARRGAGGIGEGKKVEQDIKSVLCARSAKAEATARERVGEAASRVLEALEAAGVAPTHLELPVFDIFSGHATAVDLVGVHRSTGQIVLVELKVHACSVDQVCESGGEMMKSPFHVMENSLLNHAVCQLLWAQSTIKSQYGDPDCIGMVVIVSPSGTDPAFTHFIGESKADARADVWHDAIRPDIADLFTTDSRHERRSVAAKARRVRDKSALSSRPTKRQRRSKG